jgi:hypothetical protein
MTRPTNTRAGRIAKAAPPATQSRYLGLLPRLKCGPGDHRAARAMVEKITELLEKKWKPNEQRRLRKMQTKWKRRAEGRDARFELVGNVAGRLAKDVAGQAKEISVNDRILGLIEGSKR